LRYTQRQAENKLWGFREDIRESGVLDQLFALFNEALRSRGLLPKGGHIVDAIFVEVPKQRNTRGENAEIKEGRVPKEWAGDDKLLSHKDVDARWMKNNEQTFYGYKNQVNVNSRGCAGSSFRSCCGQNVQKGSVCPVGAWGGVETFPSVSP